MTDIVVRLIDCHVVFWYNGVPQFLLLKRSENQIYPNGQNKNIKISSFANKLCGKFRPRHFKSVADVID